MIPDRLPWHGRQWERVERSIRAGRVPHALPLRGAGGNGKALFAARPAGGPAVPVGRSPMRRVRDGQRALACLAFGIAVGEPGTGRRRAAEVNDVVLVLERFALGTATGRSGRRAPAKR